MLYNTYCYYYILEIITEKTTDITIYIRCKFISCKINIFHRARASKNNHIIYTNKYTTKHHRLIISNNPILLMKLTLPKETDKTESMQHCMNALLTTPNPMHWLLILYYNNLFWNWQLPHQLRSMKKHTR